MSTRKSSFQALLFLGILGFLPVLSLDFRSQEQRAWCAEEKLDVAAGGEAEQARPTAEGEIPAILTEFEAYPGNPVFTGSSEGMWDAKIRERGWILEENGVYALWYTGYDGTRFGRKQLGLATSTDGIHWQRHPANPLIPDIWVEDVCVVKKGDTYFMFAEGEGDHAHLLTSKDWVHWQDQGELHITQTDGRPIEEGPFGTPTVWLENDQWYLYYERGDQGIWLATSQDAHSWKNYSDISLMNPGPGTYDERMVAFNQILKIGARYYAVYHGSNLRVQPSQWTTCLAYSEDLIHWKKWSHNPLTPESENKSSSILVPYGEKYRLYSMHNKVQLHFPH